MFCPKCGASIPDGVVEEKKEKKGKNVVKSILLVLLIMVLMVGSSVGTAVFIKLQNNVSKD